MVVMMVLLVALAAGVGVPSLVMRGITRRDERQKAQVEAAAEARKQERIAKRRRRKEAKARAAEEETQRDRLLRDPVNVVIPALRAALEAGVRAFEAQYRVLRAAIGRQMEMVSQAESEVGAATESLPALVRSDRGASVAVTLAWLAIPACLAFAALDLTMYRATHDPLLATAYAVLTMIMVSAVGLWVFAAVPGLFRSYDDRSKQFRSYLSASGAIVGAILMIGLLLWLAPFRSQASNNDKIAAAEGALARVQQQLDAGEPVSPETKALKQAAVERAQQTAVTDRYVDQGIVLVAMGADIVCLEGALLCFAHLGPLSRAKRRVQDEKAVLVALEGQRDQVQEAMTTQGRQVATNVWQYLDANGVPEPEAVIGEAMRRISAADLAHNAVQVARVERFDDELAAQNGRGTRPRGSVVRGVVVAVDGEPQSQPPVTEDAEPGVPEEPARAEVPEPVVDQVVDHLVREVVDSRPTVPEGGLRVGRADRPAPPASPVGGTPPVERFDPMAPVQDLDDLALI